MLWVWMLVYVVMTAWVLGHGGVREQAALCGAHSLSDQQQNQILLLSVDSALLLWKQFRSF
jgi:hypothetical protein